MNELQEKRIIGETIRCSKCGERKYKNKFYLLKRGSYSYYCIECQGSYARNNYLRNKKDAIDFLGGKCVSCGETNLFALQFHHKDSKIKDFGIHDSYMPKLANIKDELMKCELLCKNCHTLKHVDDYYKQRSPKHQKWHERVERKRNTAIKLLGGKCSSCGNDDFRLLHFHHKDPSAKLIELDKKGFGEYCWATIEEELKKCILLCGNCHLKEHYE